MKRRKVSYRSCHEIPWTIKVDCYSWQTYVVISAVATACYLNGLNGDFVHDDIPAVKLNKDVLAVSPIKELFKNDFWGTPMSDVNSHKSYRPLTTLTFRANYLLFGLQPAWYHATNIVLHVMACILFTRVCLYVAGLKRPFAAAAGLLFAVHPIHTEAVTGIVGRADVLACVFFLISLLAYHGPVDGRCHIWTSVILGGLSMLAKETGITVFVLNILYDLYKCWPFVKKTLVEVRWNEETCSFAVRATKLLFSLGLLLAVRIALLQGSLPKFSQQDNPTAFHQSLYVRLLTFSYLAAFNWWLLLCPGTLSHDWQMGSVPLVTSITDSRNLVTCLFFGFALLLTYRCIIDFEQQKNVPLVLGLFLLVLPFLPATNLLVTVGFVVAERVLYIPSLGCVLLVVYGAQILWDIFIKNRQTILFFGAIILVASMFRTVIRNRDWKSRESLLRAGLMTLPHNAKMHYNFGNFLRDTHRFELAISHYRRALQLWPSYASAHNNLGTLMRDDNLAELHFLSAIRYSAEHVNAHYNLGQLYRKTNRTIESYMMLQKCIKIEPQFTLAYLELIRLRGRDHPMTGKLLQKVVELNPTDASHITNYADWLKEKGHHILALKYYWKALLNEASYQPATLGAAKILRLQGKHSLLLQLITRWHSILRLMRGDLPLSPHVYLHSWQLKTELRNKARAYDSCPTILCGRHCIQRNTRPIQLSTIHQHESVVKSLHTACNHTARQLKCFPSNRQCRLSRNKLSNRRSSQLAMLHQILGAV